MYTTEQLAELEAFAAAYAEEAAKRPPKGVVVITTEPNPRPPAVRKHHGGEFRYDLEITRSNRDKGYADDRSTSVYARALASDAMDRKVLSKGRRKKSKMKPKNS